MRGSSRTQSEIESEVIWLHVVCWVFSGDEVIGTGFLIGPDVVLTNYHVYSDLEQSKFANCKVKFGKETVGKKNKGEYRLRESEWTPEVVCQDNQCEFGKWLYACNSDEKASPHYEKIQTMHAEFHTTAAGILKLALAGNKEEAEKLIGMGSDYRKVSGALTKEMMDWKDEL